MALSCSSTSNWKSMVHTTFGASAVAVPIRLRRRRCGLLQLRLGQQALECPVLFLELLQALRVVGLEAAVLVVRLLGHAQLAAHRRNIGSVSQHSVGLSELAHDLLRGVSLPGVRHDETSLPA